MPNLFYCLISIFLLILIEDFTSPNTKLTFSCSNCSMKRILLIIIFLCTATQAIAITEQTPEDIYTWSANSTTLYFNNSDNSIDSNCIYQDEYLKNYLTKALSTNYSVKIAKDRILQYQNLAKEVNSARLPFVSLSPNANTQRNMSTSSGNYTSTGYYNLPVQLNWELDIFGKNRGNIYSNKGLQCCTL